MKFILLHGRFYVHSLHDTPAWLSGSKRIFPTPFSKVAKYCKLILEQKLCSAIQYGEVAQMLIMIFMGMLAAFGAFCALWVLLGNWLTKTDLTVAVQPTDASEEAAVRRLLWLQSLGLLCGRVLILSEADGQHLQHLQTQFPTVEFLTKAQYLEQERKNIDGS